MGSSPVTATTLLSPEDTLERFLRQVTGWRSGVPLLVAFSGGPDSTALLATTVRRYAASTPIYAAHLDHGLDPESRQRAAHARELAKLIGAHWVHSRVELRNAPSAGIEAWARQQRYFFLEQQRQQLNAHAILTAHHLEDQLETVLLRILFGSGLRGLSAIQPWIGRVGRPWLELPATIIHRHSSNLGLPPVDDRTNSDLTLTRNWIRLHLVPRLITEDRDLLHHLAALARTASRLRTKVERRLGGSLKLQQKDSGARSIDMGQLRRLPRPLWPFALALLAPEAPKPRLSGEFFAPSGGVLRELERQVSAAAKVTVRLQQGRQLTERHGRLCLEQVPTAAEPFCRPVSLPGRVTLPGGDRIEVVAAELDPWMLVGEARRAAFEAPREANVAVRTRLPGDRIQPLGTNFERKLKEVLIDAKVDKEERDRLPLLIIRDRPVWVPGVTIDHRYRIRGKWPIWVAQWYSRRQN